MTAITILGATGSIGQSTLKVVELHPEKYTIYALTAQHSIDTLFEQCQRYQPRIAVMSDPIAAEKLETKIKKNKLPVTVLAGEAGLLEVASSHEVDCVVAAIMGAAGLMPTLAAVHAGKRILLANKEALVMAGPLFMQAVRDHNALLLPVDSEHNAIWQCLPTTKQPYQYQQLGIQRLVLTASGGPFRTFSSSELKDVTPVQALAHPNWSMGKKISIDSATMMNKGLEVIEAHWLFGITVDNIEVVIHPESIIHSFVDYVDGSMLAQMGNPDMRTPIANALAWPQRIDAGVKKLDLIQTQQLNFEAIDIARYPCLSLAYQALKLGGTSTAILNAANEVAVAAFLQNKIKFTEIAMIVEKVLTEQMSVSVDNLSTVLEADTVARKIGHRYIEGSYN